MYCRTHETSPLICALAMSVVPKYLSSIIDQLIIYVIPDDSTEEESIDGSRAHDTVARLKENPRLFIDIRKTATYHLCKPMRGWLYCVHCSQINPGSSPRFSGNADPDP
jgi:hypothetical protein